MFESVPRLHKLNRERLTDNQTKIGLCELWVLVRIVRRQRVLFHHLDNISFQSIAFCLTLAFFILRFALGIPCLGEILRAQAVGTWAVYRRVSGQQILLLALLVIFGGFAVFRAVHELVVNAVIQLCVVVNFILAVLVSTTGLKLEHFFDVTHRGN